MAALGTTIFGVSKTTVAGVLAAVIGAAGPLAAYLAAINNPKAATAAGIVTLLATIARIWVGILQGDAPPLPPPSAQVLGAMQSGQKQPPSGVGQATKTLLLGALLLGGAAGLTGCPSGSERQKIAQAAQDAAVVAQAFQQGEVIAFRNGQIPLEDHVFIEKQMVTLATLGKTLDRCIRTASDKAGAVECAQSAINTVDSLNAQGALYIKSAQAKTDYQIAMLSLRTALATIVTLEGGTAPPLATAAPTGGM